MEKLRCFESKSDQTLAHYHDQEWGVPVRNDQMLFEMIILEGAQAGLNWETILKKRSGYKDAFYNFDLQKVANMTDLELEALRQNKSIIRNRLKIYATRTNAQAFIQIQKEFGSFSNYLWSFVQNKPIINRFENFSDIPKNTKISDAISSELQKRGMKFVGSTIIYAYMQAAGLVNDHLQNCWLSNK